MELKISTEALFYDLRDKLFVVRKAIDGSFPNAQPIEGADEIVEALQRAGQEVEKLAALALGLEVDGLREFERIMAAADDNRRAHMRSFKSYWRDDYAW